MNVNLTLIVQGINFLIVFVFLRSFLFRSLAFTIQTDRKDCKDQNKDILDLEEKILLKKDFKRNQWRFLQKKFSKNFPDTSKNIITKSTKALSILLPKIDQKEVLHLVDDVKKDIIQKVSHVSI